MDIAPRIKTYLKQTNTDYDLIEHHLRNTAYGSACSAHLAPASVVKTVLLHDSVDDKYAVAIIPASYKIKLWWVNNILNRNLFLVNDAVTADLFPDCVLGTIPGFAQAYDIEMVWDEALESLRDIYFRGGNHNTLIHITHAHFMSLFQDHPCGIISTPTDCSFANHTI